MYISPGCENFAQNLDDVNLIFSESCVKKDFNLLTTLYQPILIK